MGYMDFHDLTSVLNRKMLGVALDEVHFALWFGLILYLI